MQAGRGAARPGTPGGPSTASPGLGAALWGRTRRGPRGSGNVGPMLGAARPPAATPDTKPRALAATPDLTLAHIIPLKVFLIWKMGQ